MRRGIKNDDRFIGLTVLVAAATFLLMLPPLLTAANSAGLVTGLPAVWTYLFAVWLAVILVVALIVRKMS